MARSQAKRAHSSPSSAKDKANLTIIEQPIASADATISPIPTATDGQPGTLIQPAARAPEPIVPEETIDLRWSSPFSLHPRQYHFAYRGITFIWKGTSTTKEHRWYQKCRWLAHLKLVVELPTTETSSAPRQQLCLARFRSLGAERKTGRLVILEHDLDRVVDTISLRDDEDAITVRERLHALVVATAMCMISGEAQKRKWLKTMLRVEGEDGGA
jgi:hypothetical protein